MDIPNAKGETKRQVLQHVMQSTNGEVVPPELTLNPKYPYEFRSVLDIYFKIASSRTELINISIEKTNQWLSIRGKKLSAIEHDLFEALDNVFIDEMQKRG